MSNQTQCNNNICGKFHVFPISYCIICRIFSQIAIIDCLQIHIFSFICIVTTVLFVSLCSLDPDNDPLCMLLLIDYLCHRCREYAFLIRLCDEWEVKKWP